MASVACLVTACTTGTTGDEDHGRSSGPPPAAGDGATEVFPLVDRAAHTATLLADGSVLVAGGCVTDGCGEATATTEQYDPATGRFVSGPSMAGARDGHTATTLPDGDVLVIGGYQAEGTPPLATAERYDAETGRFEPAGELATGRGAHAAVLLADGRVLVVGGWSGPRTFVASAEVWDPQTSSFSAAGSMAIRRAAHTATVLPDGRVLVAGGEDTPANGVASSEVYDPAGQTWSAGPALTEPRFKHAAVLVGDTPYLIGGTPDDDRLLTSVERYDPASGRFVPAGAVGEGRYKFGDAVVPLADGRILMAGGGRTVELFDVDTGTATPVVAGPGSRASFATATALPDGHVLVVGGYDDRIDLRRSAMVLDLPA